MVGLRGCVCRCVYLFGFSSGTAGRILMSDTFKFSGLDRKSVFKGQGDPMSKVTGSTWGQKVPTFFKFNIYIPWSRGNTVLS